jgi:hypothetical protein
MQFGSGSATVRATHTSPHPAWRAMILQGLGGDDGNVCFGQPHSFCLSWSSCLPYSLQSGSRELRGPAGRKLSPDPG